MNYSEKPYLSTRDFLVTDRSFDLKYDSEFEMLTTFPKPNEKELPDFYQSEDYISHTDSNKGLLAWLYQTVKKWSLNKKVNLITKENNSAGTLLDIGAGTGDFLKVAKEKGWSVQGVEPNISAIDLAKSKGICLRKEIEEFSSDQFDVVTLWHVLEHVPNLEETIEQLGNLVKPDGVLIIAVPNFKSYDAEYYGKFWAAFDVPRHLWHFSSKSIKMLFSKEFTLQKIKPLIFDSFYVSLLSEKYKTANSFSINAIWIGLMSNLKAIQTKQYSSLIYVLKRKE